jgi:hypothetical protein
LSFTWLSPNAEGKVFYQSGSPSRISEIPSEGQPMVCPPTADVTPFAFGPAGKLYVAHPGGGLEVTTYPSAAPSKKLLAEGLQIRAFTVRNSGDIYVVAGTPEGANELWFLPSGGKQVRLDAGIKGASGIAPSPDGLWLFVAQSLSRSGLSYRIRSDGTVDSREPFYDFYVPSWADDSGVAGISMDREGRAYAATRMGVQVFDRNGRVTAILPLPGNVPATGICFGGPDFDTLYVAGGGRIYKRKLHVAGALPFAAPVKLPRGNAG